MKYKTTQKAVKAGYFNLIVVPYASLQHVLDHYGANAYTAGAYGWNADIYQIDDKTAIVTGYRPFGNIRPDRETVRKYDDMGRAVEDGPKPDGMTWPDYYHAQDVKKREILYNFICEVLNNER